MRVRRSAVALLAVAITTVGCGSTSRRAARGERVSVARLRDAFREERLALDVVPALVGAPPAYWIETHSGAQPSAAVVLFPTSSSATASAPRSDVVVVANVELWFFGNATQSQRSRMLDALTRAAATT